MNLAFVLYKYFPFGGLQRDFLRIALECQQRGHRIRVYCMQWSGEVPAGFERHVAPLRAFSSHRRNEKFSRWLADELQQNPADRVIGFNKMPGLDFYYAQSWLRRLGGRYRHFLAYERAVFSAQSSTQILLISKMQQPLFVKHYATPANRLHLLPPGLGQDRKRPPDADARRAAFRHEWRLKDDDLLLLQIGSGFKTKGLDRSLKALAALPWSIKQRTRLIAIGEDNPKAFLQQAKQLGVGEQVSILPGRDDIPDFLLGADVLIHPAYFESAGMVLLEALVFGLPVLVTASCGYAHHVEDAKGGQVLAEPFDQRSLNETLAKMLQDKAARSTYQKNALAFAAQTDLYALHAQAAEWILSDEADAG